MGVSFALFVFFPFDCHCFIALARQSYLIYPYHIENKKGETHLLIYLQTLEFLS